MAKRKRRPVRRKKTSTGRIYVAAVMLFLVVVMAVQIINLYTKNQDYKVREEALEKEVDAANDKKEELKEYENYVGSDQYIEDQASQKLGLTHDNWIIFRQKEN